MSLLKPKIPYVQTTAESLTKNAIPIPKDASELMKHFVRQTEKSTKEYNSINRKYTLKKLGRVQGNHKQDSNQKSRIDLFKANKTQAELITKGRELCENVISFAYLFNFFFSGQVVNSNDIQLESCGKTISKFKNDYFGKDFVITFDLNNKLNTTSDFGKGSIMSKIDKKCIQDVKPSNECIELVRSFNVGDMLLINYVDIVKHMWTTLSDFKDDQKFAKANHAVSFALEDAKDKLIEQNQETMVHVNSALSKLKEVTNLRRDLNSTMSDLGKFIDRLEPVVGKIKDPGVKADFGKVCTEYEAFEGRLEAVDDQISNAKSAIKYFNNTTYGNFDDKGVQAPTKRLVVSAKKEAECLVKNILKGSSTGIIIQKFKSCTKKMKLATDAVNVYLNSQYYANTYYVNNTASQSTTPIFSLETQNSESYNTEVVNRSSLTVQDIVNWYENDQRSRNPVLGFVLKISTVKKQNQKITQEYRVAIKIIEKYYDKIYEYRTILVEIQIKVTKLGTAVAYLISTKCTIDKSVKVVAQYISVLLTIATALGLVFG